MSFGSDRFTSKTFPSMIVTSDHFEMNMNIFFLHDQPFIAATYHCDKHCVKMILEYAQLLSTAHRVLDGSIALENRTTKTGKVRRVKVYKLPDDRDGALYKVTHINHPSAIWARECIGNYFWLHKLLEHLCEEYTIRYKRIHKVESSGLLDKLSTRPTKIPDIHLTTKPSLAMPDDCKVDSPIQSYRNYYIKYKSKIAVWKYTETPEWYNASV